MNTAEVQAALDYVAHVPPTSDDGALVAVLLHGRGSDKRDLQGLRPLLPPTWTVVTPEAPFPAAHWGYGGGSAWYRYVAEDRVIADTLDESLDKLERFLGELPRILGFRPGRLILGGFSQGGTTSLAFALSRPDSVDMVLNFSGFLVDTAELDESGGSPPTTPIFWGHGVGDPSIPFALAEKGRNRLLRAGAPLVVRDYRIGHSIAAEEVRDAVATVERVD